MALDPLLQGILDRLSQTPVAGAAVPRPRPVAPTPPPTLDPRTAVGLVPRAGFDENGAPIRPPMAVPPPPVAPVAPPVAPPVVPQGDRLRFLEQNVNFPAMDQARPDATASIADWMALRQRQGNAVEGRATAESASAQADLMNAKIAYDTDPSEANLLLLNRALNRARTAERDFGMAPVDAPDFDWAKETAASVAAKGLNLLDVPRQMVVTEMGANAYDVATGKKTDWGAELAAVAPGNWMVPGLDGTRLSQDFERWAEDPTNWPLIRNAAENGFQASPTDPRFTGGRAVWELFINSAGLGYKTVMDVLLDPTIMLGTARSAGTGTKVVGEAIAGEGASPAAKGIGTGVRILGKALEVPQNVSDVTVDAVIPGILKGAKAGAERVPVVGPVVRKAFEKSPQELARAEGDRVIFEGQNKLTAIQQSRRLTGNQAAEAVPPAASIEEIPAQTALPQPAQAEARFPLPDEVAASPTETPNVTKPIQRNTGEERDWTNPDYQQALTDDLRTRYDAGTVDNYAAAREQHAAAYRARQNAKDSGSKRGPLDHVTFVVEQRQIFRDHFPDEPFPVHRFRNGDDLVLGNRQNMIEHAVFGTDDDARQVRNWFYSKGQTGMARKLGTLREQAAGQTSLPATTADAIPAPQRIPEDAPTAAAAQPEIPLDRVPENQTTGIPGYGTTTIDNLVVDTASFQNRKAPFSEQSVTKITSGFDPRQLQPIEVARNADGTYTVLSGHSRREAIRRLVEAGQLPPDFEIPIKVQEGTPEELKRLAQTSNMTGTPNTPTEQGAVIKGLLDSGMSLDDALKQVSVKRGDANRLLSLTNLPTELQTAVDGGQLSVKQGALLGDAVGSGTLTPQEAANFYLSEIATKGYSDVELADALKVMRDMKADVPQNQMMGLFGDADLGSSGASEAFDLIRTLGKQRRQLAATRKNVAATLRKRGGTYSEATQRELQADVDRLQSEVEGLEIRLGMRPETPTTYRRPQPSDVGVMPYFWRLAQHERATRQAERAQRHAMQVRLSSQQLGPGPIEPIVADETTEVLNQTFKTHPKYQGRTYDDVLQELMGVPWEAATVEDLHRAGAPFRDAIAIERNVPDPTLWERTIVRAGRGFSAFMLMPLWNAPRMLLVNTGIGNSMQALIGGQARALRTMWGPEHVRALEKLAWKNEIPTSSPVWELYTRRGLGGFDPAHFGHSVTDAVIGKKAENAMRRAGGKARPGLVSMIRPGDFVAKWTGQNLTRNANNGLEWSARTGMAGFHFDMRTKAWESVWADEAASKLGKKAPEITEAEFRAMVAQLPPDFSATDVFKDLERLALSAGMDKTKARDLAREIGKDWANKVNVAHKEASAFVDKIFFDLSERNADRFLKGVVPFHMWYSRAIPFYVEQGIRHPGFAAAYYRMLQGTEAQAEAEGWPDSLKGYLKMWTGPGGIALFFNPIAAMSLLDVFVMHDGGYTPENMTRLGKALTTASGFGFGLLPWWSAILNYGGYLGSSSIGLDPVGTYSARKVFGSFVQLAAAHGLLGDDWQKYIGKPFEQVLQDIRGFTSGHLPGSVNIPAEDPGAYGAEQIRNIMLTRYLDQIGLTEEEYRALGAAPYGSDDYRQYEQVNDAVLADWDAQGPLYDEATRDYADSGAYQVLAERVIMGGTKTRQVSQLERANAAYEGVTGATPQTAAQPFRLLAEDPYADGRITGNEIRWLTDYKKTFGVDYKQGDLDRMRAALRSEQQVTNLTTEAAPLAAAQTQYHLLGTPEDRAKADYWNDIAFASVGQYTPVNFGGKTYTNADLMGLTQDERFALADAWLERHDPAGSAQKLRDERKVFVESHPEYKQFVAWRREMNDAWGTYGDGGLSLYRRQLAKENPNAARWITEETRKIYAKTPNATPTEVRKELDRRMQSLSAYEAIHGIKHNLGDPNPLNAEADPRPLGWSADGGSGGSGEPQKPWDVRVKDAVAAMDRWVASANAALSQVYGTRVDYANLPPIVKQDADARLAAMGIVEPEDAWIAAKYRDFQRQAAMMGQNGSIEAFIVATSKPEASAGT